jgi:branched-subunit amino acid transport protein
MNHQTALIIFGAALATYSTRFPLLLYSGPKHIPTWLEKCLSFIAPAILTALIIPTIFIQQGKVNVTPTNHYLIGSGISIIIAYIFKNPLVTVIVGVLTVGILVYWI